MALRRRTLARNTDAPLQLGGIHAAIAVLIVVLCAGVAFRAGLRPGALCAAVLWLSAIVIGWFKKPWAFTHFLLFLGRRGTVYSPAVPPDPEVRQRLKNARRVYEGHCVAAQS